MKRMLSFRVRDQLIEKDPTCSFKDIVSGTSNYLQARFTMNATWKGYACVAVFRKMLDEYPVVLHGGKCDIPAEATDWDKFYVRIVGKKPDGSILTTDETEVTQTRKGGV